VTAASKQLLWSLSLVAMLAAALTSSDGLARSKGHGAGQGPAAARARKLLDDGIAALSGRDLKSATRALEDSYRSQPSAEALFYLGAVALADGRTLEAQDLMRRYLADPRLAASSDSPETQQAQRITAQAMPAHGQISILGEDGTLVSVDGRLRGGLPISHPLLVPPGERTVTLESGGRKQDQSIAITEGQFFEIQHSPASGAIVVVQLPSVLLVNSIDPSSEDALPFSREATSSLRAEHFAVLPDAQRDSQLSRCLDDPSCLARLGERAAADYLLVVRPEHQASGWNMRLQLLDIRVGEVAAQADAHCASCTAQLAAEKLSSALQPLLLQTKSRPRGKVQLTSKPSGAEVYLGERLLGRTPLTHALWAGAHDLAFTFSGLQRQVQRVTITQDQTTELNVELLPPSVAAVPASAASALGVPPASRRSRLRETLAHLSPQIAGAGSIAVGALLLGFGASGLHAARQCDGPRVPAGVVCPETYHTTVPGATLTAFGSALILTGVGLIVVPKLARLPRRK